MLGEDSLEKRRNTVLSLLGMNLLLRVVDKNYHLNRELPSEPSQLQFECDTNGIKCLVYHKDFVN